MAMEQTYGNNTKKIRDHFQAVQGRFGKVSKLGMDRFCYLLAALQPSCAQLTEVAAIFHETFTSHVQDISVIAIDETMIEYQPSAVVKKKADDAGEPIPVVFIPRKPHPNGLLLYQAVTIVPNPKDASRTLPYILDIFPHVQQGDSAPTDAFLTFLDRWIGIDRPHIIADAAFGSFSTLEHVTKWGGSATFSFTSTNTPWLWELLSFGVPPAHWRAAWNSEISCLASVHAVVDLNGRKVFQQILSSAFAATLHTEAPLPLDINQAALARLPSMPVFTEESLKKMTVQEMRCICKSFNIKQGKKKESFVHNILNRSNTLHNEGLETERIARTIQRGALADPALPHDTYKEYFNLVDLVDRRWYGIEEHHGHHSWKGKLVLAMLRFGVMNAWVYGSNFRYASWRSWREEAFQELMKYN